MDAKKIIDRINNPAELQYDDAKEWNELTEKHPYFSVGQLLQYGNDYFQEKDNVEFTAIYKSDSIQFAQFANELKSVEKRALKKNKQEKLNVETIETPVVTVETVKSPISPKEDILAMIRARQKQ